MAKTYCNGDQTQMSIPQAFSDLTGSISGSQLPGTTGTGNVVMQTSPTFSGTVVLPATSQTGLLTKYNNIATAGNGQPAIVAVVSSTGLSATQTGVSLLASSLATGLYRLSGYIKKTTAATTSSTIGPLTVTYADGGDSTSLTPTIAMITSAGAVATTNATNSATVTGMTSLVPFTFFAKTGTAITYSLTYASSGTTAMVYELYLRLESL